MTERKPEALIGVFVRQLNAALADENAALLAEIERLRAALREAARRLIANGDGYGANEAMAATTP